MDSSQSRRILSGRGERIVRRPAWSITTVRSRLFPGPGGGTEHRDHPRKGPPPPSDPEIRGAQKDQSQKPLLLRPSFRKRDSFSAFQNPGRSMGFHLAEPVAEKEMDRGLAFRGTVCAFIADAQSVSVSGFRLKFRPGGPGAEFKEIAGRARTEIHQEFHSLRGVGGKGYGITRPGNLPLPPVGRREKNPLQRRTVQTVMLQTPSRRSYGAVLMRVFVTSSSGTPGLMRMRYS